MNNQGKVLVLGGSGFLGSHVADRLSIDGYDVRIFDRQYSRYLRNDQSMIVGDILDQKALSTAAEGCDYLYNFAGIADIHDAHENPVLTNQLNVLGNTYALEAAKQCGIKRYVFASTVYVYSNSGSFYRVSKQAAEKFIEAYYDAYGLEFTILRYGSLYGRRADMRNSIYRYIKEALINKKIIYDGSKHSMREYIQVEDAAKLSVQILRDEFVNKHIILTGQEKMAVHQLFKMISEMMPHLIDIEYTPGMQDGHYEYTPYKFQPSLGEKLVLNAFIDLGQGILDIMADIHANLSENTVSKLVEELV